MIECNEYTTKDKMGMNGGTNEKENFNAVIDYVINHYAVFNFGWVCWYKI